MTTASPPRLNSPDAVVDVPSFTPGPWTYSNGASGCSDMRDDMFDWSSPVECIAPYQESDDSDLAGQVVDEQVVAAGRGRTPQEAIANARLIAAAPTMLEALQAIADESVFNQQRFAEDTDTDYFLRCFKAVKDRARAAIARATGAAK